MARLKYLTYILIPFAAVLFMSHNVFAEMPPVEASDQGVLSLVYQSCTETTYNGRTYYNCENPRTRDFNRTLVNNDNGTVSQLFTYDIPDDLVGSGKYIRIQRLTYTTSSEFVSSGDNIFYSISSSYSPYLGSARPFISNDTGTRYTYDIGGFNAYIWSSRWNDMFSCADQDNDVCQLKFNWDTTTGIGSDFYVSNAFTMPSGWSSFSGIDLVHSLYDNTDEAYYWTPYPDNSTLFMLNTWNDIPYSSGTAYLEFYVDFFKLSEFYDLAETGGVNVNDVLQGMLDAENNISSQNPLDLNIGNSETATNLISYISTFIEYITDISPAQNCNLSLPFPNFMGGAAVANLCQGKETMGNLVPVISSIVIFAFYIPFALSMLRIIYREIRSFTNG